MAVPVCCCLACKDRARGANTAGILLSRSRSASRMQSATMTLAHDPERRSVRQCRREARGRKQPPSLCCLAPKLPAAPATRGQPNGPTSMLSRLRQRIQPTLRAQRSERVVGRSLRACSTVCGCPAAGLCLLAHPAMPARDSLQHNHAGGCPTEWLLLMRWASLPARRWHWWMAAVGRQCRKRHCTLAAEQTPSSAALAIACTLRGCLAVHLCCNNSSPRALEARMGQARHSCGIMWAGREARLVLVQHRFLHQLLRKRKTCSGRADQETTTGDLSCCWVSWALCLRVRLQS